MDKGLDVIWVGNKCDGNFDFISETEVCFASGSFIKVCKTNEFSEIPISGPVCGIGWLTTECSLGLIAISDRSMKTNIYIISYQDFAVLSKLTYDTHCNFLSVCFAEKDYLLTLDDSPFIVVTLWNWKTRVKIASMEHTSSLHDSQTCNMSTHPSYQNLSCIHQFHQVYFYEINSICQDVKFERKAIYLPLVADREGTSTLTEPEVEKITWFDKMQHKLWGLHSELLHELPLKVLCSDMSNSEIVQFYDYLCNETRLTPSCHCWLPKKDIVIACSNGSVILIQSDNLNAKIVHFSEEPVLERNSEKFISCMALNSTGLFIATGNGTVSIVSNIDEWELNRKFQIDSFPKLMKFTPDYNDLVIGDDNGCLILNQVSSENGSMYYLASSTDCSPVVGVYIADELHCISAKASGLVESWELGSGAPLSEMNMRDELICMEGSPAVSIVIIAAITSYLHVINTVNVNDLKLIYGIKLDEVPLNIIRYETFGRLAALASRNNNVFLFSCIPSNGFSVVGYFNVKHKIKYVSMTCKESEKYISFFLLCNSKNYSTEAFDVMISLEIPVDIFSNFKEYWEDESGFLDMVSLKYKETNIEFSCSSFAVHPELGLYICIPLKNIMHNIQFNSFPELDLSRNKMVCSIDHDSERCELTLSPSRDLLLHIDEYGKITIWKILNLHVFTVAEVSHISTASIIPKVSFSWDEDVILSGGGDGAIVCYKNPFPSMNRRKPWILQLNNKRKEDNELVSKIEVNNDDERISWLSAHINTLNEGTIRNLQNERNEVVQFYNEIKQQLEKLARENFVLPPEHQIPSEDFIFDEEVRQEMIKTREASVQIRRRSLQAKIDQKFKVVSDIQEMCLRNMMVKGYILKPLKEGRHLYNYSIPSVSTVEMKKINHTFKKNQMNKFLQLLKEMRNVPETQESLDFTGPFTEEDKESICCDLRQEPFQLQSCEDRLGYVHILKYIILRKRMAFNRLFENLADTRKEMISKIVANNRRIKEIWNMIDEEGDLWQPKSTYSEYESLFNVTDEEIANACCLAEDNSKTQKGIAEDFLKDEWLTKRKFSSKKKFKTRLKKENVDRLKKEVEKKLKMNMEFTEEYDRLHDKIVDEKLLWDLDINQEELQIFLLLFTVKNSSEFKKWEIYLRKHIQYLESFLITYTPRIEEMDAAIFEYKKIKDNLENEIYVLDNDVQQISKISRNKVAFFESYNKRPEVKAEEFGLNPFKNVDKGLKNVKEMFGKLNLVRNKPLRVPVNLWKQLCSIRENKAVLEEKIKEKERERENYIMEKNKMKSLQATLKANISEEKELLKSVHEIRLRCTYETPKIVSISDSQLEMKYPEDLDFKKVLFLRRHHMESLNYMITNVGEEKLEVVQKVSKTNFQIERNLAKIRKIDSDIKEMRRDIEIIKSIPLTKDIQKIIQNPESFSLFAKIEAAEKSGQMEKRELEKQKRQAEERIASVKTRMDNLTKEMSEKIREIETLKGDLAELYKLNKMKGVQK